LRLLRREVNQRTHMRQRTRKLIGIFATLLFLGVYALIAMAIGGQFVVGGHQVLTLVYFLTAGVAWIPVAMALIKWMAKPDLAGVDVTEPVGERKGQA
jgi:hypothetical protein